ncbi:hypothetical protein BBB56_06030 [Candidatus Pantoea deserta]|uniref:Uncharacterized protein n=1 Tax=Candidatus Pantoea deserta TaxID=1869313 RepID=A0A3N4P6J9_9GAMM|nr:hypothetical protein [Pantoea deserta]RPE02958.1 hypothetical protein BBB56_06030 [Pantoea deserta]
MSKDTGGAAFPCEQHEKQDGSWNETFDAGMTLRDYFAAKAMQASLPDPAYSTWDAARHARRAYSVADAMIAARGLE